MDTYEKDVNTISNSLLKECANNAVFTQSQVKEIIRIDSIFSQHILEYIKCLPKSESSQDKIQELASEILRLIEYDEHNTEIVSQIRCDLNHLDKELTCTETQLHELSEKTSLALISQDHEFKKLEVSVHKILDILCIFETKENVDKIIKRLSLHEAKEIRDSRVESLICKIEKMERINEAQNLHIAQLSEQIVNLTKKTDRNTIALDNKIDIVEKRESVDAKIDSEQNANIRFLQGEVAKLNGEIERLERAFLLKN